MKSGISRAINRCFNHGIAITNSQFEKLVKEYNNFEMPLSTRIMMIARDWDEGFFEFAIVDYCPMLIRIFVLNVVGNALVAINLVVAVMNHKFNKNTYDNGKRK